MPPVIIILVSPVITVDNSDQLLVMAPGGDGHDHR